MFAALVFCAAAAAAAAALAISEEVSDRLAVARTRRVGGASSRAEPDVFIREQAESKRVRRDPVALHAPGEGRLATFCPTTGRGSSRRNKRCLPATARQAMTRLSLFQEEVLKKTR